MLKLNTKDRELVAIGKRLRRLRFLAGYSREELAKRADVSVTSISFWENASANPMTPRSIKKVLEAIQKAGIKCNEQWLLTGSGQTPFIIEKQEDIKEEQPIANSNSKTNKEGSNTNLSELLANELRNFQAFNRDAVIFKVENNSMLPAIEAGDIVGGFWQDNDESLNDKLCIVQFNKVIQVRRVRITSQKGVYDLSFLAYDSSQIEPYELKSIKPERIAVIVRIWK